MTMNDYYFYNYMPAYSSSTSSSTHFLSLTGHCLTHSHSQSIISREESTAE